TTEASRSPTQAHTRAKVDSSIYDRVCHFNLRATPALVRSTRPAPRRAHESFRSQLRRPHHQGQTRAPQHLPKTRPTHARPHARIRTPAPTDRSHPPPSPAAPPRSRASHTLHATRCTRAPTPRLSQPPYHQTPRARPAAAPPRQNSPTPCAADRPSASPPNHARVPDARHARH